MSSSGASDNQPTAETIQTSAETSQKPVPAAKRRGGRPPKSRGAPKTSDNGQDRWTIRGVPLNVRKLVLAEAEARGMTLGDFVAEALVGYLKGKSADPAVSAASQASVPATVSQNELAGQVAEMLNRLRALEERQSRGFLGRLFGGR